MKILFLSFFFEPDLSAGSFRASAILSQMDKVLPKNVEIHVLTTMPNRYISYKENANKIERIGRCIINRVSVDSSSSGFLGQILRFLKYFRFVRQYANKHKFEKVFATSGRMFTAATAVFIAKKQGIKSYLDIRDIFVDTINSVFKNPLLKPLKYLFNLIEAYTFTNASKINLISPGFIPYFNKKYPDIKNFDLYTNGIDESTFSGKEESELPIELRRLFLEKNKKYLFYAGNIGESQELDILVPNLAKKLEDNYEIIIVGDGNARSKLEKKINSCSINNVHIISPIKRELIFESYKYVDVLFTNLANAKAFEKVIPSKLFEYGASGLPILVGACGYPAQFVDENIENSKVFMPSNANDAFHKLKELHLVKISRDKFCSDFSRSKIVKDMVDKILEE